MVNSEFFKFKTICYLVGTPDNHEVSCKNIILVLEKAASTTQPILLLVKH